MKNDRVVRRNILLWIFVIGLGQVPSLAAEPVPGILQGFAPQAQNQSEALRRMGKIQENIRTLYARENPDLAQIADLYRNLFALLPHSQQGKTAIWESFHIRRRLKDTMTCLALLRLIYQTYRFDETMENPRDRAHPIHLHATADLEQATLHQDLSGQALVSIDQMRNIPMRHPGATVGAMDGDRSYLGEVEIIVLLKSTEAYIQARQYDAAFGSLRRILEKHSGGSIGLFRGAQDVDWLVMRVLGDILHVMPMDIVKKLSELKVLEGMTVSKPAKAEACFLRAMLHEERGTQWGSAQDIMVAEGEYRRVIMEFHGLLYNTDKGKEAMGPRGILGLVRLYTELVKDPVKALRVLEEMENATTGIPSGKETAAYARLHQALILYQRLGDPVKAMNLLEGFDATFPQARLFPILGKTPRLLFQVAGRWEREIRQTLEGRGAPELP